MLRNFIFWILTLAILVIGSGCARKNYSPAADSMSTVTPVSSKEAAKDASSQENSMANASGAEIAISDGRHLETVYFDYDSYVLKQEAQTLLQKNATFLKEDPSMAITIEGHCDERGSDEYNLALGDQRAKAIRDYLVALGIGANRLAMVSYGEERPAVPGHDETSWEKNRRAEFK